MSRLVVTRSERYDIAEWVGHGPPEGEGSDYAPAPRRRDDTAWTLLLSVLLLAAVVGGVAYFVRKRPAPVVPLAPTVADLVAVHPGVTVEGHPIRQLVRLSEGDHVETDGNGRARLRLDRGADVIVDRDSKLTIDDKGMTVEHGRVFVTAHEGWTTEVSVGDATAILNGVTTGISRPVTARGSATIYAANAELTVRVDASETKVSAGETAHVEGTTVEVKPERSFDDWTGGMAAPWAASGPPRRALGEMWGRVSGAEPGDPGSPLTIRSLEVHALVTGEVAETSVQSTFFNAGSADVVGDFRMAIPPGAIVSRFATRRADVERAGVLAMAARGEWQRTPPDDVLEWAGEGWLRGTLPNIAPGQTVTVTVDYVEWLTPHPNPHNPTGDTVVVQYRYPMVGDGDAPLIGEFFASVDATPSSARSLGAGLGARVSEGRVELRKPDFRPVADLVVDVEIPAYPTPARSYAVDPIGDDPSGRVVVVRTEAPPARDDAGITLALLVDTSGSIEPALLEAERAFVEAVVGALSPEDRVVVLAADQGARPVGPDDIGPATPERRSAIVDALGAVRPGGATDLGRALEAAADHLPADAPAGLVVYVGDGWPTIGDRSVDAVRARLSRRAGGAPRLAAVAVGPVANRYALAALVRGSGPLLELADSSDAARVGVDLLSSALRPTLAEVEVDLGPAVERVYPRGARAVAAGETLTVVGRVRGELPSSLRLSYRDGAATRVEERAITSLEVANEQDVRRRWAAARVDEIILGGKGKEAAVDVALRHSLTTPWTAWTLSGGAQYVSTPLSTRVLDLAAGPDAAFAPLLNTSAVTMGTLAASRDASSASNSAPSMEAAVATAARRAIDGASAAVRACRDSRAALRPELSGSLVVTLELAGDGTIGNLSVRGDANADDEALNRCVAVVVDGLSFPQSGATTTVEVRHVIVLPAPEPSLRGRKCSPTSTLLLPLRRGVWRERLTRQAAPEVYLEARRSCELPTWSARRSLLELMLEVAANGPARLAVARALFTAGEEDAATFLRRETVRRAATPDDLRVIRGILLADEMYPKDEFAKDYRLAKTDRARLAVVQRYLELAPHDAVLRRRQLALLEALDEKDILLEEIRRVRLDPFADAETLADAASLLARLGDRTEAERAFGELAERAPTDPWARAFLGDRLLAEGWFDLATDAYETLDAMVPNSPAASMRLAIAHARAERTDIAHRMLTRVAQTGGRQASVELSELADLFARVAVAEASARADLDDGDRLRLERVALEHQAPPGATMVLIEAPPSAPEVSATLHRGAEPNADVRGPEASAAPLGLWALRVEPTSTEPLALWLTRPEELAPARPLTVRVHVLSPPTGQEVGRHATVDVDLPPSGDPQKLTFRDGAFVSGRP